MIVHLSPLQGTPLTPDAAQLDGGRRERSGADKDLGVKDKGHTPALKGPVGG